MKKTLILILLSSLFITNKVFANPKPCVYEYIEPKYPTTLGLSIYKSQTKNDSDVNGFVFTVIMPYACIYATERILTNERTENDKKLTTVEFIGRAPLNLPYGFVPVVGLGASEFTEFKNTIEVRDTKFGILGTVGTYKKLNSHLYLSIDLSTHVFENNNFFTSTQKIITKEYNIIGNSLWHVYLGRLSFIKHGDDYSGYYGGLGYSYRLKSNDKKLDQNSFK